MLRSRSRTPHLTGHFRVQKRRPLVPTRDGFSRERIRRERKIFTKFPWVVFLDDRPSPLPPAVSPRHSPRAARASRFRPSPHSSLSPLDPRVSPISSPLKKPLLSAGPAPRHTRGGGSPPAPGFSSVFCHHRHPRSIGAGFGYVGAGTRGTFGGARGVTSSPARSSPPPPSIPRAGPGPAPASPTAPASAPRAASHVTSPGPVTTSAYGCSDRPRDPANVARDDANDETRRASRADPEAATQATRILSGCRRSLLASTTPVLCEIRCVRVGLSPTRPRIGISIAHSNRHHLIRDSKSNRRGGDAGERDDLEVEVVGETLRRRREGMAGGGSVHASVARAPAGPHRRPRRHVKVDTNRHHRYHHRRSRPRASVRVARGRAPATPHDQRPTPDAASVVHGEHPSRATPHRRSSSPSSLRATGNDLPRCTRPCPCRIEGGGSILSPDL